MWGFNHHIAGNFVSYDQALNFNYNSVICFLHDLHYLKSDLGSNFKCSYILGFFCYSKIAMFLQINLSQLLLLLHYHKSTMTMTKRTRSHLWYSKWVISLTCEAPARITSNRNLWTVIVVLIGSLYYIYELLNTFYLQSFIIYHTVIIIYRYTGIWLLSV